MCTGQVELRSVFPYTATLEASVHTEAGWEGESAHPVHSLPLACLVHLTHPSRPGPIPSSGRVPLPTPMT